MLEYITETASSMYNSARKTVQTVGLTACLLAAGATYSPSAEANQIEKEKPVPVTYTLESKAKELPHFMREINLKKCDNEVDQIIEKYRVFHATKARYFTNKNAAETFSNNCVKTTFELYGKKVEMILPEYEIRDNGQAFYITNQSRTPISKDEITIVQTYLMSRLKESVDTAFDDHLHYTKKIIEKDEIVLKKLKLLKEDENLIDRLNDVIPGYERKRS